MILPAVSTHQAKMGCLLHVNVQHVTTEDKIWFPQRHFQEIVSLFPIIISNHKVLINMSLH